MLFRKREHFITKIMIILVLLVVVLWVVIPIWIVVTNSFKPTLEIRRVPPSIIFTPTLQHFRDTISVEAFGSYFVNSLIVAGTTTLISIVFGSLGGYGLWLARKTWGKKVSNLMLIGRLVPAITILIPFFVMLHTVGLIGTYVGPILAHSSVNLPFVIWLMLGFMRAIPEELFESGLIDGASRMKILFRIYMPMLSAAIGAAFILSMQFSWNELLFSLQLTGLDTYTLPVGVARYVGAVSVNWGQGSAAATITMLPIIIIGFVMQKYFVSGMTAGAVKE